MGITKNKMALILFIMTAVFFWTVPPSVLAVSRGITVKAKTRTGALKKLKLYSGYYALVIGCNNYSSGWPYLQNPDKDAEQVASMLKGWGWNVRLLKDPVGKTLKREFNMLVAGPGRKKDKAILVWFSGHGHTLLEADGTKLGYLVPVDAPDPDKDLLGFMEKSLSMRQVETVSKQILSKHVLMLFDTCFSGAIFQMTRAKPSAYIQEKVSYPVREFITAGTEDEEVPDKSMFKQVFIQGLTNGFADLNQDDYITGEEIGAYLQENVINYSHRTQHPKFGRINNPFLDKGDFVFVLNKPGDPSLASTRTNTLEEENLNLKNKLKEMMKDKSPATGDTGKLAYGNADAANKRKLAIFPIYQGRMLPKNTVDEFKMFATYILKATNDIPDINLTSSVYPYDSYYTDHSIADTSKFFNKKVIKNIWYGNSWWAKEKPDLKVLKKISKQINADLVLIFKVEKDPSGYDIKYNGYLVDVKKGVYYKKLTENTNSFLFTNFGILEDITKDLFEKYKNNNPPTYSRY